MEREAHPPTVLVGVCCAPLRSGRPGKGDIVVDDGVRTDRHLTRVRQVQTAEGYLVTPDLAQEVLKDLDGELLAGTAAITEAEWRKSRVGRSRALRRRTGVQTFADVRPTPWPAALRRAGWRRGKRRWPGSRRGFRSLWPGGDFRAAKNGVRAANRTSSGTNTPGLERGGVVRQLGGAIRAAVSGCGSANSPKRGREARGRGLRITPAPSRGHCAPTSAL